MKSLVEGTKSTRGTSGCLVPAQEQLVVQASRLPGQPGRPYHRNAWVIFLAALGLMAILAVRPVPAQAATYSWTHSAGSTGDWSLKTNWGGTLPTGSDDAYIVNGGTATVATTADTCYNLWLGGATGSGTVQMTGGSLSFAQSGSWCVVGDSGTGTFTQSAGTATFSTSAHSILSGVYLGYNAGSLGTYNLSSTGQLFAPYEFAGVAGTGNFTQSGGTNTVWGALYLSPFDSSGIGTYNLYGTGQLLAGSEYVGFGGAGSFTQSGGANTAFNSVLGAGYLYLGDSSSSGGGTYSLNGTGQLSATYEYVGHTGIGSLMQSGGTNSAGILSLGYSSASSSGTYSLSSGSLSAAQQTVGSAGTGLFMQSGGTNSASAYLYLGSSPGSNGTYNLSGTGQLSSPSEWVGISGTGSFMQSGGTNTVSVSGTLYLGLNSTGSGSYDLGGTGRLSAWSEEVGWVGPGTFTQSGGTNAVAASLSLAGQSATSNGTYSLSGSGQLAASSEYVGFSGTGNFTQSGGTNAVTNSLYLGNTTNTGTYSLSGNGQLSASCEYVGSPGTGNFAQSGGTNSVSNTLFVGSNGGSASYSTYTLSGGLLIAGTEVIGGAPGFGGFTQTGGTNAVSGNLSVGYDNNKSMVYNLRGGLLVVPQISTPDGPPVLNFSGGTLQAAGAFSTSLPIVLDTGGDNGTFNTAGYAVTLSGAISGPGNLVKIGGGTLVLAATSTYTYTGSTAVNAGVLSLTGSLNNSSALAVGGGTFGYAPTAHGGSGNSQAVAGLTVNVGVSTVNASAGNTLALGPMTRYTGGVVDFNSGTTGGTITTTQPNANGILGPWATYGSGTSMSYAAASGGSAPYTIAAYTGGTSITSGAAGLTDTTGTVSYALSSTGGALAAAANVNTLQFTGSGGTITASTANSLTLNGIMNVGSGTAAIAGGNLVIGSTRELVLTGPGNMTIGAAIQDNASGASALTMAGGGMLALSGSNTYSGSTFLSGGTLALGNSAALRESTLDTSGGGIVSFGSLTAATLGGLAGPGTLSLTNTASAAVAISVGNNNAGTTFSGILQGAGSLIKIGSGTLTLSGGNTYTGGTTVASGTLVAENAGAIPGGSLLEIDAGGSLVLGMTGSAYVEGFGQLAGSPLGSQAAGASGGVMAPAVGGPQAGAPLHAVPEPGTAALLAVAAACGLAIARRMKEKG